MAGVALVTGAAGFTGPYVVSELKKRGYEVHGTSHAGKAVEGAHASHEVDLKEAEAVEQLVASVQPNYVLHLAAIAFVAHDDLTDMYVSNIIGTRNLLSALVPHAARIKRILLASSANVYGTTGDQCLDEDAAPNPQNDYAVSKYAMEMMARLFLDRLPLIITRPFNYIGAGQSPSFVVPKIVGHIARREAKIELGNIDVYRDFSDVRMVADAYARLLEHGVPGTVYNVCSGTECSIRDILDELVRISGHEIDVNINPKFVRANEVTRLSGSRNRLESCIGELKTFAMADTLRWMYQDAISQ